MMEKRRPIIGVMGSSDRSWKEYAVPLGELIAEFDYHLLTGAGGGVMTAVAEAFVNEKGRSGLSIGVIPTVDYKGSFIPRDKYPNPYIEIPIVTPLDIKAQNDSNPFSRNYVNVMTSNAVVLLPGEHGTRNEAALALKFAKPMILFGPEDEFKAFPEQPTRVQQIEEVREFLEKVSTGEGV